MTSLATEVHYDLNPADDAEFVDFLAEYAHVPRRRVRRLLGSVDDVEDVVQETVIRLYVKWRLGRVEDLDPKLLNTMSNGCAVDHLRSAANRREVPVDGAVMRPLAESQTEVGADPADVVTRREYLRVLLAELSHADALLVWLRAGHRYSYDELVEVFGSTADNLRQRHRRAMQVLAAKAERMPPRVWVPTVLGACWRALRRLVRVVTSLPTVANAAAWGLFLATVAVTPTGTAVRRRTPEQQARRLGAASGAGRPPSGRAAPSSVTAVATRGTAQSAVTPGAALTARLVGGVRQPKPHKPSVCVEGTLDCQKRMPGDYVIVDVVPGKKVEAGQPYVPMCDVMPTAPPYVTCSREP
jgi:RNA polymerase sigma factor (sigma-70 family)